MISHKYTLQGAQSSIMHIARKYQTAELVQHRCMKTSKNVLETK
jgi:hypothetical protein